ncbi:hypothetical protein GUJ93_ZPchr0012g19975 [Zizania palustris]|uniref:Uncharacterized protein n=1 Tax=Zizania palustris TaxID=103762 RepID=A0A8J5WN54_ZIZPA|nr:hypothetical protein GUJ93_ZPchr0012g19975 [Zizania palustris]
MLCSLYLRAEEATDQRQRAAGQARRQSRGGEGQAAGTGAPGGRQPAASALAGWLLCGLRLCLRPASVPLVSRIRERLSGAWGRWPLGLGWASSGWRLAGRRASGAWGPGGDRRRRNKLAMAHGAPTRRQAGKAKRHCGRNWGFGEN